MNEAKFFHLDALEAGLAHEKARLAREGNSPHPGRVAWIAQREKEIAGEREFLRLPKTESLPEISDEELLRELKA